MTHGPGVKVLSVSRPRRGGYLGFFAREICAVSYTLVEDGAAETDPIDLVGPTPGDATPAEATPDDATAEGSAVPALALIDGADGADGRDASAPLAPRPAAGPFPPLTAVDFASALAAARAAAAQTAAQTAAKKAEPAPVPEPVVPIELPTPWAWRPPEPPPQELPPTSTRLEMLTALREVGVPVPLAPGSNETSLYRAVEQVIEQLPAAPRPPQRAGDILALVGPRTESLKIAHAIAPLMHVPRESVWVVDPYTGAAPHVLGGPREAARQAAVLRDADVPAIVVVDIAADDVAVDGEFSWCAQVIAALSATAVWAVVDASRKTTDVRSELDRLGALDALAVFGVAKTSSPATVWDLEVPIALLDGRRATPGAWSALMFDVLRRPGDRAGAGSSAGSDWEQACFVAQ
jgi:hypothetical protein